MSAFSGKVHLNFAILIWLLLVFNGKAWIPPIPFFIGSVFPDCDIRYSMIGKVFPMWIFFKHRGWIHSWYGLILFSLPWLYHSWEWSLSFAAGFLLHLLMDSSTPSGIRWFAQKTKRKRFARSR